MLESEIEFLKSYQIKLDDDYYQIFSKSPIIGSINWFFFEPETRAMILVKVTDAWLTANG